MKTVSVRITSEQAEYLQKLADQIPGGSISGLAQRAVGLWREVEGPVYEMALKETQDRLTRKRAAFETAAKKHAA